jgi:hypothetical protein
VDDEEQPALDGRNLEMRKYDRRCRALSVLSIVSPGGGIVAGCRSLAAEHSRARSAAIPEQTSASPGEPAAGAEWRLAVRGVPSHIDTSARACVLWSQPRPWGGLPLRPIVSGELASPALGTVSRSVRGRTFVNTQNSGLSCWRTLQGEAGSRRMAKRDGHSQAMSSWWRSKFRFC